MGIVIMVIGFGLFCMALLGVAVFFTAKGIAYALGSAAYLLFQRRPPAAALRLASAACTLCLLILLPMRGCDYLQVQMYRKAIPPQFELLDAIYHDEISGFREGCGMAIFRLSDESIARIHHGGLGYLESARQGRDGTPYHHYEPWTATPASKQENLFRGAHCVKNAPALLQQAQRLVDKEGAFFTTGPEHDLVLVPSLGLIIFSYDG
jgi:hypothetical protein